MNIELIKEYIKTGDFDLIYEEDEILFWVDWREEDSSIVEYCEEIIQSGSLKGIEKGEYNLDIEYKGKSYSVKYPNDYADRDTTLVSLNEIIKDNYEIRLAVDSDGSDTLAFLVLENKTWKDLEEEYGDLVNKYFRKLEKGKPIFE